MKVLDFAIEVERSGRDFYKKLAESTDRVGLRKIFGMMVKDEQKLLERFRSLKADGIKGSAGNSATLDRAGNLFNALDPGEVLARLQNDLDAYRFILEIEQSLFTLYEEAAERESDRGVRDLLLRIAEAEHREHESIRKVYEFTNAPNEFLAWGEFSNLEEYHNFGRDEG